MPKGSGRIAIAGAGMTGAYLYRLLTQAGWEVDLFDREQHTRCGLTPCAWGTSADFPRLVARAGLDPERYLLRKLDGITLETLRLKMELNTIDKPKLIRDLLAGAEISRAPLPRTGYHRIIDATGTSRALLPPIPVDVVLNCHQYLVETEAPLETVVRLVGIGYAWCFPLSPGRYHLGCGSLLEDPRRIMSRLGWLDGSLGSPLRTVCACSGTIRLSGAHHSGPFVVPGTPSIWGIGEAIGCVAPLVGDGIVPGLRSAEILLENWERPGAYHEAILSEFRWMKDEREVFDALHRGDAVGVREARILLRNSRRMKIRLGLGEVLGILKILALNYLSRPAPVPGDPGLAP